MNAIRTLQDIDLVARKVARAFDGSPPSGLVIRISLSITDYITLQNMIAEFSATTRELKDLFKGELTYCREGVKCIIQIENPKNHDKS